MSDKASITIFISRFPTLVGTTLSLDIITQFVCIVFPSISNVKHHSPHHFSVKSFHHQIPPIQTPLHTLTPSLYHAITPAAPATTPTNPIFLYPFPAAAPVTCALALALVSATVAVLLTLLVVVTDALVRNTSSLELPLTPVWIPLISVIPVALETAGDAVSIAKPVGAVDSSDMGGVRKLA